MPQPAPGSLAERIAQAALLRGQFTLRSGRTSTWYLDKYLFSTRPEILAPLADLFAQRLADWSARLNLRPARLAGAELGGIPLVTAASLRTGLPCVLVRNQKKTYGTGRQIEGALEKGDTVILLEDVATTGGQALEAVETLRAAGARVPGVIAVIDRLEGARANLESAGLVFDALFTRRDLGIDD